MRKSIICVLAALMLCACMSARASDTPYGGYSSTPYGTVAPSPIGYAVKSVVFGNDMGAGALNKPSDMYFEPVTGKMYIADTGNARVIVLDADLQYICEYTHAGEHALKSPKGVFADARGNIYIADDALGLTLMLNARGELVRAYARPVSELYEDSTPYAPQKVVADSAGRVYVLSQGVYQGLVCFNADGSFLSFYGANRVEVTAKVALQKLLRVFMTREQRANMESFIPIEYVNIDIDGEDMIYAAVGTVEQEGGLSVYKLNPLGAAYRKLPAGQLTDLLADENGYYTCLKRDTREIVEFGETTASIALTCGGNGTQKGLFQDPVALARVGDDLLALDRQTGGITVFTPTPFGRAVHDAISLSAQGKYKEAVELYKALIRMDSYYMTAYQGLGKAYYEMEMYEESMRAYRLAQNREGYSEAFKEYSTRILRDNMAYIISGAVIFTVAVKLLGRYRRARKAKIGAGAEVRAIKGWRHPFHCMTHAYSGFEDIKLRGTGSFTAACALLGALFLSSVISYVLTGFAYNPNRIEKLNVLLLFAGSLGAFGLFYVASLAVSSLMSECEGKPRELFIAESYALLPYILGALIVSVITNFVSLDVKPFVTLFTLFCVGWSVILLVMGMMQINQLTLGKTLLYLLLVIFAVCIVLVLMVLLYSLVQQFIVFWQTIYGELMYRL